MIVGLCTDPILRAALRRTAHPEEDIFLDERLTGSALELGFPRVVVYVPEDGHALLRRLPQLDARVRTVAVTHATLRAWEAQRRTYEVPPPRVDHLAAQLRALLARDAAAPTRVDRALADLSRAAGARLPAPLRSVARRVMEFPVHYVDLHGLAEVSRATRGALKARFRRRGLPSPSLYMRWFRMMAAAQLLADREVTTIEAAHRLGFATGGNLCRTITSVTGLTSSELRSVQGWNRMLVTFGWKYLGKDALAQWETLDDLFVREAA
jgi:AraC-like DNA-binding protein